MSERKVNVSIAADVQRYVDFIHMAERSRERVPETHDARRARICLSTGCTFAEFDLAYRFGYEPESWDGMYKLRQRRPIVQLSRNWAVAAEVVEEPGTHRAVRTLRGRQKIRYVLRRARDAQ